MDRGAQQLVNASAFSRRALLAGVTAAACGRKRGPRYQGWLFVASGAEKAVVVADLASFRRLTTISLPYAPDQLFHSGGRIFALCREAQALIEIDSMQFRVASRFVLPRKPVSARLRPDGTSAIVLTDQPGALLAIDLTKRRIAARLPLDGAPSDLDVNGNMAAIAVPDRNAVARVSIPEWKSAGVTGIGLPCGILRFRRDGKTILAGATAARQIVTIDAQSGQMLAKLPLPISPERFCVNPVGGEMFVTGPGEDSVVIVSTFQNEVDQTILAGRTPGAMAISERRNLLFVTNPESGDLTILDIENRALSASVHVGENPGEVLLTPDGEYALVLDRRSGNVSVVRITTVLGNEGVRGRLKTKPLFTVFPTKSDARSAIIVPFES
jgi:YVTN family beta-propeller protein